MVTKLSINVKTHGLAKNKILVILGVLGAILLSALAFGILTTDKENKMNETDNLAIYQDNFQSPDRLLNEVLAKKQIASTVVSKSASVIPTDNSGALDMVPPITRNIHQVLPQWQAEERYHKKQILHKPVSYGARTLMYSNTINSTSSGSSSPVTGMKSVMPVNSNEKPGVYGAASYEESSTGINSGVRPQRQFIENSKTGNTDYLSSGLSYARSPYEIKAGSIIPATMINGLNSDLPGQIIAQVRENVYDSSTRQYLLIPQGAKLVGLYDSSIIYGQKRVLAAWNRLIYPDGSWINLKAMPGTDLEGYAGFYDEVDNKYWQIFGSSFILGVITAAIQYSQNNTNANVQAGGIGVVTNNNPTIGETLGGSLGQQLGQTGLSITQKNLNVQPTLIVKPNYPFNIMITADMILRPLPMK